MTTNRKPFKRHKNGVMIFVRLRPCASANRIDGIQKLPDGSVCLVVRVTAAPEKGRANQALVKLLAKAWGVSQSSLSIVAGAKERTKTLLLEGDAAAGMLMLRRWQAEGLG